MCGMKRLRGLPLQWLQPCCAKGAVRVPAQVNRAAASQRAKAALTASGPAARDDQAAPAAAMVGVPGRARCSRRRIEAALSAPSQGGGPGRARATMHRAAARPVTPLLLRPPPRTGGGRGASLATPHFAFVSSSSSTSDPPSPHSPAPSHLSSCNYLSRSLALSLSLPPPSLSAADYRLGRHPRLPLRRVRGHVPIACGGRGRGAGSVGMAEDLWISQVGVNGNKIVG